MKNIACMRQEKDEVIKSARKLLDKAESENRKLTNLEDNTYEALLAKVDKMEAEILEEEALQQREMRGEFGKTAVDDCYGSHAVSPGEVRSFGKEDIGELRSQFGGHSPDGKLDFGRWLKAIVTGDARHAQNELRQEPIMVVGDGGGYLVPEQLWGEIMVDALNKTQVLQAGARVVRMDSMSLRVPKITGYPAHEWLAETAEASPDEFTFDKEDITAKKLSVQCDMSIELFEDSPLLTAEISSHMSKAIALAIDEAALVGADGGPQGVYNTEGVQRISDIGTLTGYGPFSQAWGLLESANYTPNGLIANPQTFADLDALTAGTDGQPLRPPESWGFYRKYPTSQIPLVDGYEQPHTFAVLADWRRLFWCIRTDARVEVTRDTTEAWRQYLVKVRVYFRGNVSVIHPQAFCILDDITPASDYES